MVIAGASYLTYVSLMNQVVIMGTQIYHDACVTQHHKYAAHQMALLYVSVYNCASWELPLSAAPAVCLFYDVGLTVPGVRAYACVAMPQHASR